jgi:hypothetical protein
MIFSLFNKKNSYFVVSEIDLHIRCVHVEDLSTGKRMAVSYGNREIAHARFSDDHELEITYQDGSEKRIDILQLKRKK